MGQIQLIYGVTEFANLFFALLRYHFHASKAGLPDFSWCKTPKQGKIYQMTVKSSKWH
jgi:hypothetical protein